MINVKGKNEMKKSQLVISTIAIGMLVAFATTTDRAFAASKEEIKQEKADIRKMANEALARLYKVKPSAKKAVSKSAGYAVFSNFGTKIFIVGGGGGKGIVVDNKTQKETFMKMIEVQAGLGIGIKKFRLVWVFENRKDLTDFINSG